MVFIGNTFKSVIKYIKKKAVSNLDEESKWTVHYSAPWHQQENVFLPSTRPACVEDLHRQAKVNLKNVLRDCDKLRKDGFRSSQYYSQGPIFSGSNVSDDSLQEDEEADKKSEASLEDEDEKPMYSARPQSDDGYDAGSSAHSGWSKTNPLPTPEERMRQQAQAVPADIIPINITGETFDRQASIRRSLANTDTVVRWPKKVKRRKTISGMPDSVQKELAARGHSDLRPHSMYLPGQFSNPGSANPGLRRTNTRDFSCQTEEVKIVPPSMRRIRAQRGQGIAAQMAVLSASSSGSISTASDSVGNISIFMAQHNGGSQRFHSLPRQGARISLNFEPDCGSAPYRPEDCSAGSPQTQNGRIQADDTTVHLRNSLRAGAMPRPKSEEVRSTLSDQPMGGPACAVSPHTAFSTSLIPNATLSCSAEVITIHTANSCGGSVTPQVQVSTYPPERASSTAAVNGGLSATSSHRDSAVSLSTNTEADSQCSTLNGTKSMNSQDTTSESSYSDGSFQSRGTIGADHWVYDTPEKVLPKRPLTSSCSTPTNHIYSSLERSSNKTDASSLHSIDNDGYYTSMHTDSGLRSRSHNNIHRQMRHSMYECRSRDNQDDHTSFYSDKSLSRSISLRKLKKPPLPPARTDSLRRKPGKKTGTNGSILNETLIASLQQSLQMGIKAKGSSSPSQSPCSDYEDPWVLRSRSQSSVSAGSSGPNMYYICPITPSQSDTSSLRSDYAESWGYYADYPRAHGEQPQSLASTPGEYSNGSCLPVIAQASLPVTQDGAVAVKPKAATSPDRVHRLTSPSSGYSSQSNTPTAGTPVPSFMRPMSPAGLKAKPKVPERKSSLLSSVSMSSSSTSLSSNTSDSTRNPLPPPLLSMTIPHTSPSMTPTFTLPKEPLLTPPPPPTPPASIPACTVENFIPPPLDPVLHPTPVMTQDVSISSSDFPPPPPEVLFDSILLVNETESQLLPPPPPPLPPLLAMTPPAAPPISFREGALRPLNANFTDSVAKEDSRLASSCSGEARKSPMPLVTTQDLQKVQLRSVKKLEHEGAVTTKAQETGHDLKSIKPRTPEKNKNLQPPNVLSLTVCSSPTPNGAETQPSPTKQAGQEAGTLDIMLAESLEDHSEDSSRHKQTYLGSPDEPPLASPAVPSLNLTPKKKPPAISKKPKLSFMIPQTHGQPVSEEGQTRVQEADMTASGFSFSGIIERHGEPLQQEESNNSRISKTPLMQGRESLSSEVSADNLQVAKTSALVTQGLTLTDDKSSSEKDHNGDRDGDPSSTMGSICSKQEENGDVFEDSDASHTPTAADRDVCEDMVTPTRPRTTEDLFAAIHRSKRKVLGRRESDEERSQGHSPSPPVTPTSGSPGLACPPRQTGSIQRSLRRSATSSDSFKALLLKKGSRSEAGFRMSATEMLKSTDPRFQRSRLESSPESPVPDSPSGSPGRGKRVPEEWARTEGLSTRFAISSSHSGPKYGRSRMPPSAASSKYNARSRILSSPMTVICEREGELTEGELAEASNDCEDIEGPPPPPQASNGTSCEGDGS